MNNVHLKRKIKTSLKKTNEDKYEPIKDMD